MTRSTGIKPVVLIVMDGYGCTDADFGNAICHADTRTLDRYVAENPHGLIAASGLAVGLPAGQMGNSEVGHLNLGAGKVVYQDFTRVSQSIEDGSFFDNPAMLTACKHARVRGSTLHVMGLVGYGGVHAHQKHLYAVLELAQRQGIERLAVHAFTDGRDSFPNDAIKAIADLEGKLAELGSGVIATVSGRYYAMDRDNRWDRTALAYRAITAGEGPTAASASEALERSYAGGITDEFVVPTIIVTSGHPAATVQEHDAVIFFNFRTDRPRQLVRAFVATEFDGFDRGPRIPDIGFVTMTEYAKGLPVLVAFRSQDVDMPLARVISEHGLKQLHAAETEKYAHVTFFFNGGREQPFEGEDRILVPSPREVGTYDKIPEMSAFGIADQVVAALTEHDYAFVLVNFANADMVGHTGSMEATEIAVGTVNVCVGRVVEAAISRGGIAVITADHGNAEQMIDPLTGGPFTSHTISNPVPFVVVAGEHPELHTCEVRDGGILADVAPTILNLMGIPKPEQMVGTDLLRCSPRGTDQ
jgi:2,3-bisphosphoglycerate-independent phosphoglycerate mutase